MTERPFSCSLSHWLKQHTIKYLTGPEQNTSLSNDLSFVNSSVKCECIGFRPGLCTVSPRRSAITWEEERWSPDHFWTAPARFRCSGVNQQTTDERGHLFLCEVLSLGEWM